MPKNPDETPPAPDPAATGKAFKAVLPRLKALSPDAVLALNADLQDAAIVALSVAGFLAMPEAKTRFGHLSAKVFDAKNVEELEPTALAAYHISIELRSARATATEAKLPVDLVDAALELKERMLELASYVFKKDKKLSLEVADIRTGTGYKDLASDLSRLAKIYEDNKAIVSKDTVNYKSTDAKDARRLAQQILAELGRERSKDEATWVDLAARVWTVLRQAYDEVQAAGVFLYRHEEPEKKFPSLYVSSRGRPRKGSGDQGKPPTEGPGTPPAGNG
jgi:hypothetical protein